jgi:hypothetical protein
MAVFCNKVYQTLVAMRNAIENGLVLFAVFGGALTVLLVIRAVAWWLNQRYEQKRAEAAAARAMARPLLDLRVHSNRVPGVVLPQTYQHPRLDAGMKDAKNSDVWLSFNRAPPE